MSALAEILGRVRVEDWHTGNCATCQEWGPRTVETDECAGCAVIERGLATPEETEMLRRDFARRTA